MYSSRLAGAACGAAVLCPVAAGCCARVPTTPATMTTAATINAMFRFTLTLLYWGMGFL